MLVGTLGHVLIPGLIFLAIHILVSATPLRGVAVRAVGQRVYLALFSLVSLAAFIWLILAYREAPFISIWYLPALAWVGIIVMPFAFIGAIAGNTTSSRAKSGTGSTNDDPSDVAVGVFKITRHPFLWSVVLWSGAHLLVNGDLASLIMFGTFLALGLVGPHSSDAKRRKKDPEAWRRIAAETSYVPFAAILSGRASVTPGEIGWWRILLGVALYAVFLAGHGWIFGAPILG